MYQNNLSEMHAFQAAQHAEGLVRHLVQLKMFLQAGKSYTTFLPNSGSSSDSALSRDLGIPLSILKLLLKRG